MEPIIPFMTLWLYIKVSNELIGLVKTPSKRGNLTLKLLLCNQIFSPISEKNELNTGYGYSHTRSTAPFTGACRLNRGVAYSSFTLHRTRTPTGTRKWWVSALCYVLYTLHRDRDRHREPLFSIVPISFPVPVPVPLPWSVYEPLGPHVSP